MILPNAVIVGVNKAGTTSLFHMLASHPDVTPANVKETHFFDPLIYGGELPSLDDYAAFFPTTVAGRVVLEATPSYFYGGLRLARAMNGALPRPRVVLVLREPGDRAFSWWRFARSRQFVSPDLSFAEYLQGCARLGETPEESVELVGWRGLSGGRYSNYLPAWQQVFGDRLLVLFHDDLVAHPDATLAQVCCHLGLPSIAGAARRRDNVTTDVANPSLQRLALSVNRTGERLWRAFPSLKSSLRQAYYLVNARSSQEQMAPADREWLNAHFQSDLVRLRAQLLERPNLPLWLRQ